MAKTAFIFPGQGSQIVGMGKDLYEGNDIASGMYGRAEEIVEFPLREISFQGPENLLKQSQYTQPAIFTHSVILDHLLKLRGQEPVAVAGHSLGEYSAVVSAGALTFETALRLVKIRGQLMQSAGEKNPGTMAAVLGMSREDIEKVCDEASAAGVVQPANFNSPGQIVISGSIAGVHRAMELAAQKGARLVKELDVSGAFHSPLMREALEGLVDALESTEFKTASVPVYSNVEAKPVTAPDAIKDSLKRGLLSPVLWENIVRNMVSDGIEEAVELGPGRVLQGLVKRIDRNLKCSGISNLQDIEQFQKKEEE